MRISDRSSDVCSSDLSGRAVRIARMIATTAAVRPIRTSFFSCPSSPVASSARVLTRSEEHTSELQPLMRLSYAVFCLKNTKDLYIYQIQHVVARAPILTARFYKEHIIGCPTCS